MNVPVGSKVGVTGDHVRQGQVGTLVNYIQSKGAIKSVDQVCVKFDDDGQEMILPRRNICALPKR